MEGRMTMKNNRQRRMSPIEQVASTLSVTSGKPWFILRKNGYEDKAMTEDSVKRFMQLGYKVICVYFKGDRYKNMYTIDGRLQFVM